MDNEQDSQNLAVPEGDRLNRALSSGASSEDETGSSDGYCHSAASGTDDEEQPNDYGTSEEDEAVGDYRSASESDDESRAAQSDNDEPTMVGTLANQAAGPLGGPPGVAVGSNTARFGGHRSEEQLGVIQSQQLLRSGTVTRKSIDDDQVSILDADDERFALAEDGAGSDGDVQSQPVGPESSDNNNDTDEKSSAEQNRSAESDQQASCQPRKKLRRTPLEDTRTPSSTAASESLYAAAVATTPDVAAAIISARSQAGTDQSQRKESSTFINHPQSSSIQQSPNRNSDRTESAHSQSWAAGFSAITTAQQPTATTSVQPPKPRFCTSTPQQPSTLSVESNFRASESYADNRPSGSGDLERNTQRPIDGPSSAASTSYDNQRDTSRHSDHHKESINDNLRRIISSSHHRGDRNQNRGCQRWGSDRRAFDLGGADRWQRRGSGQQGCSGEGSRMGAGHLAQQAGRRSDGRYLYSGRSSAPVNYEPNIGNQDRHHQQATDHSSNRPWRGQTRHEGGWGELQGLGAARSRGWSGEGRGGFHSEQARADYNRPFSGSSDLQDGSNLRKRTASGPPQYGGNEELMDVHFGVRREQFDRIDSGRHDNRLAQSAIAEPGADLGLSHNYGNRQHNFAVDRNENIAARAMPQRAGGEDQHYDQEAPEQQQQRWEIDRVLAEQFLIGPGAVRHIIGLLSEHPLPFVARYYRYEVSNLTPPQLRMFKNVHIDLVKVRKKADDLLVKFRDANGECIAGLEGLLSELLACQREEEFDRIKVLHLYATNARSKANKARSLGLQNIANSILWQGMSFDLRDFVTGNPGLSNIAKVQIGVENIIAEQIAMDNGLRQYAMRLLDQNVVYITSSESKQNNVPSAANKRKKEAPVAKHVAQDDLREKLLNRVSSLVSSSNENQQQNARREKFRKYFDFRRTTSRIEDHEILALNRGEDEKILNVSVELPAELHDRLLQHVRKKWIYNGSEQRRTQIIENSFRDANQRLIVPFLCRDVRGKLLHKAQRAATALFTQNLRKLLLAPQFKQTMIGIHPGRENGCKLAVVSEHGKPLEFRGFRLLEYSADRENPPDPMEVIAELVEKYQCRLFAVGSGRGNREVQKLLSRVNRHVMNRRDGVQWDTVREEGLQHYANSESAKDEFREFRLDHDTRFIRAVAIARRLQDPLNEFIKVDPKYLGIGLYQHDFTTAQMSKALNDVVRDICSCIGADLNVASGSLLRMMQGIGKARADHIVKYRDKNGPFVCREQLKDVPTIGPDVFKHCSRFLTVLPRAGAEPSGERAVATARKHRAKKSYVREPLDATSLHPESTPGKELTKRLLYRITLNLESVGTAKFIKQIRDAERELGIARLSRELETDRGTLEHILSVLKQPLGYDPRKAMEVHFRAAFRSDIVRTSQLKLGHKLSGKVKNVAGFGVFVDVGVGIDGMIPINRLQGAGDRAASLEIGDRVRVRVTDIRRNADHQPTQIDLDLIETLFTMKKFTWV